MPSRKRGSGSADWWAPSGSRGEQEWAWGHARGQTRSGEAQQTAMATDETARPLGEYVYTPWPCTITAYPAQTEPDRWKAVYRKAAEVGCAVSLGGKRTRARKHRQIADLTIKGAKAVEFFWWLFDLSRRVFEGGPLAQQFASLPRPSLVEERHVDGEEVKQEYDERLGDWGDTPDSDDDLGDTGGDLAEDTPDDAGGGSAPPPGAGGCAPPPAEGEESVLDRLRRAAREAKDGLPVYTQDTIEEAAGGALRPAPPELMQEMRRHRVIFCTVCFGRGWQVRRALPATLLRLWPYTEVAKVMLILAGPEYDDPAHPDLEWLKYHCQGALHTGLLQVHIAAMPHWHASVGKNSAHRVACEYAWHVWGDAANPVLVTLDCDNIIGSNYMKHIAKFMQQSRESDNYECSMGCVGCGNQGVTGRNVYFMRAFLKVRVYDEAM